MVNKKIPSESEQMYLVSMARLAESVDECPIPVSQVAELLGVTSISANQMIHHLEEIGLVTYTPYKGVEFTEDGWRSAAKILKNRRLWEVFLVEKLQYDPQEGETLACRLEHAISDEMAQRLAEFLGWPTVSPQGKSIPEAGSESILQSGATLNSLPANACAVIISIQSGAEVQKYLEQSGMYTGGEISVLASQQGGPILIKTAEGKTINLSAELSKSIWVKPKSPQ